MFRLFLIGLLLGATVLIGCGPDVRYDVQVELDLRTQTAASARAQRDGWLQIIFSRAGGPWIETKHAFAVGKKDALSLRREGTLVIAGATGREVQLDEFRPETDRWRWLIAWKTTAGRWADLRGLD